MKPLPIIPIRSGALPDLPMAPIPSARLEQILPQEPGLAPGGALVCGPPSILVWETPGDPALVAATYLYDGRYPGEGLQVGAEANIKTITEVYEAFGRGDVAVILDAVTDDVDWAAEAASPGAPWYGVRHGKDAVAAFFSEFGSAMEVEEFMPVSFAANDTDVLTVVRFRARSRSTGRTAEMNLHHYFKFRDGKVAFYRGTEDTAQTAAVLQG